MLQFTKKVLALCAVFQLTLGTLGSAFAAEPQLRVMDTTAGKPAMIMVVGEPKEVVSLQITNPFKSTISQNFQLNEAGVLQYWYPQSVVAGEYKVAYKNQVQSFFVQAGLPDTQKSVFELSDYTAYVGGKIEGKIVLKDHYGNLISGRQLKVENKGNASVTCSNNCRTNGQGLLYVSVMSQNPGLKKLTVLDVDTGSKVFQEDLGFIPYVQPSVTNTNPYQSFGSTPSTFNTQPEFDFVPVFDPTQATFDAQGNNDQLLGNTFSQYLGADLLSDSRKFLAQVNTTDTLVQQTNPTGFHIIFGTDTEEEFTEEATVQANSALDFIVKAVDAQGEVITGYTGDVEFQISPTGPLLPPDYKFTGVDQGMALFELSLVLPAGEYTFIVQDTLNPSLKGEVTVTAQLAGIQSLNNTEIILNLDSPVANSVYSGTMSVQGSVNTDNTEIVVKEGPLELKKTGVDAEKRFNFALELADGLHTLDITAIYLVDGSQTTTSVAVEVDKTPPVIEKVYSDIPATRAGENFTMTVDAEENSILKAFINNRSYDFVGVGKTYTLNAKAPLDVGQFPITLQIADEVGNMDTVQDAGILVVTEPLNQLGNLFGIPGIGTMTLSWDPIPGAVSYDVKYQSILGANEEPISTQTSKITLENLSSEVSYVFTVTAKNAAGEDASLPTETRALKSLAAQQGSTSQPLEEVLPLTDLKPSAEVQTVPIRHTSSGPEVYVLIIASILMLNFYGRARKAFAKAE
jgi:hypothetical protein